MQKRKKILKTPPEKKAHQKACEEHQYCMMCWCRCVCVCVWVCVCVCLCVCAWVWWMAVSASMSVSKHTCVYSALAWACMWQIWPSGQYRYISLHLFINTCVIIFHFITQKHTPEACTTICQESNCVHDVNLTKRIPKLLNLSNRN